MSRMGTRRSSGIRAHRTLSLRSGAIRVPTAKIRGEERAAKRSNGRDVALASDSDASSETDQVSAEYTISLKSLDHHSAYRAAASDFAQLSMESPNRPRQGRLLASDTEPQVPISSPDGFPTVYTSDTSSQPELPFDVDPDEHTPPQTPPEPQGTPQKKPRLSAIPPTPEKTPHRRSSVGMRRSIPMASLDDDEPPLVHNEDEWMDGNDFGSRLDEIQDGSPLTSGVVHSSIPTFQLNGATTTTSSGRRPPISGKADSLGMPPSLTRIGPRALQFGPSTPAVRTDMLQAPGTGPPALHRRVTMTPHAHPRIPASAGRPPRYSTGLSLPQLRTAVPNPFSPDAGERNMRLNEMEPLVDSEVDGMHLSRYITDFEELKKIGKGSFGQVYKCRHRIDGWLYAVKRSNKPIRSTAQTRAALQEVYALAALTGNIHIVRYYNAFSDRDGHLYIQTELCEEGNLYDRFVSGYRFTEVQLLDILWQVADGLNYIHSRGLVHLDVKPENIFLSNGVYKVGDMGLTLPSTSTNAQEGDARYLSREVLQEDMSNLPAGDIFSLGAMMYELALGRDLPERGEEWNNIRDAKLEPIPYSAPASALIARMLHPVPSVRPTASEILLTDLVQRAHTQAEAKSPSAVEVDLRRRLDSLTGENAKLKTEIAKLSRYFG